VAAPHPSVGWHSPRLASNDGQITEMRRAVATPIQIPEWGYLTTTRTDDSLDFGHLNDGGRLSIGIDGAIATREITGPADWFGLAVSAYPLPITFGLWDGWQVSPEDRAGAALVIRHSSGATVTVHDTKDHAVAATHGLSHKTVENWTIEPLRAFRSESVPARVEQYRSEANGPITDTVISFLVWPSTISIHAEAPPDSSGAQAAINELLATLRFYQPS